MKFLSTCFFIAILYMAIINPNGNRIARNLFKLGGSLVNVAVEVTENITKELRK